MSEVSEAELGRTSAKDLQMDCTVAQKAQGSLSDDITESADYSGRGEGVTDEELYDIDVNSIESDVEKTDVVQKGEEEIQTEIEYTNSDDEDVQDNGGAAAYVTSNVEDGKRKNSHNAKTTEMPEENGSSQAKERVMAEGFHASSAAEIPVTSNGDLDESTEDVFNRDSFAGPAGAHSLSQSCVSASNFASTTEGIIESGPYKGSVSQPTSPVGPVAPSSAVAVRLARSLSDSQAVKDAMTGQAISGAVVVSDDLKNPAMEKLDLVRKWSINTYKCTRQILSEKLGRGSKTVDLELEAQIEVLRNNKRKYEHVVKLAQTLASQLSQMMQTQKQLGDAFADLSLKSPELYEEFGFNAETQRLLSKNGETLLGAINFFIASVNTLVDKTIEDTMINIKQYEVARVEYDAYRTDLEELNLGPRDANTMPKIEQSQMYFQIHREKYERMRTDVSIKLKFLEENKVKVLHNQLMLFHNAIAAYYAGNQQQLEQTLKQFHIKLKMPGGDTPSWLEEH